MRILYCPEFCTCTFQRNPAIQEDKIQVQKMVITNILEPQEPMLFFKKYFFFPFSFKKIKSLQSQLTRWVFQKTQNQFYACPFDICTSSSFYSSNQTLQFSRGQDYQFIPNIQRDFPFFSMKFYYTVCIVLQQTFQNKKGI